MAAITAQYVNIKEICKQGVLEAYHNAFYLETDDNPSKAVCRLCLSH